LIIKKHKLTKNILNIIIKMKLKKKKNK